MITEVRKKIAKELSLVLTERAREESALPTDLWKRPVRTKLYPLIIEIFYWDICN